MATVSSVSTRALAAAALLVATVVVATSEFPSPSSAPTEADPRPPIRDPGCDDVGITPIAFLELSYGLAPAPHSSPMHSRGS